MKESNLLFCEENSAGIKISETTLQDLNIDQIIRAIQEPDSLMLLNESFATTTEQEGSEIAYDIILALLEAGERTFRMVQGEPELTSFGLDLYEEIIGE